jgi:hypothetical protein
MRHVSIGASRTPALIVTVRQLRRLADGLDGSLDLLIASTGSDQKRYEQNQYECSVTS